MAGIKEKLKAIDLQKLKDKFGSIFLGPQDVWASTSAATRSRSSGSRGKRTVPAKGLGASAHRREAGRFPRRAQAADDQSAEGFPHQKALPIKRTATAISGISVIVRYVKFPC